MKILQARGLHVVKDRRATQADKTLKQAHEFREQSLQHLQAQKDLRAVAEQTMRGHRQHLLARGSISSVELMASLQWGDKLKAQLASRHGEVVRAEQAVSQADTGVRAATDARRSAYRSREKASRLLEQTTRLHTLARVMKEECQQEESAEALAMRAFQRGIEL
jgi:hypothetical protein